MSTVDPSIQTIIAAAVAETVAAMHAGVIPPRRYVNSAEAARRIGIEPETLSYMRTRKTGPEYSGAGRFIRYEVTEIDRWMGAQPKAAASNDEADA